MKLTNRIIIAALATAIAVPAVSFAAKGERKKKSENAAVTFETADKDKNESVSEAEYVAAMAGKLDETSAKSRFATLDKNSDGKLTKDEYNAGNDEGKKKRKKKN
jgi:Ca2+-binding EF-hand superfamily protein